MPDSWELANGLNPLDPDDSRATGPSGYTWLEVWLDARHRTIMGLPPPP